MNIIKDILKANNGKSISGYESVGQFVKSKGGYLKILSLGSKPPYKLLIIKEETSLTFFHKNMRRLFSISIEDIIVFNNSGQALAKVTGGGGGSSITGALIGNAVFGPIGALIGSRKKTKIETVVNDQRRVVLSFFDSGEVVNLSFGWEGDEIFNNLIPEKNCDVVMTKNEESANNVNSKDTNLKYDNLKKIADLKDNGILTEEEYQKEKKKILG